jgi:hypothetical protein
LTEATEVLVHRHEEVVKEKDARIEELEKKLQELC